MLTLTEHSQSDVGVRETAYELQEKPAAEGKVEYGKSYRGSDGVKAKLGCVIGSGHVGCKGWIPLGQ